MSVFTMLNTAQRNRQKVSTVVAMAQVGLYYKNLRSSKVRYFIFSELATNLNIIEQLTTSLVAQILTSKSHHQVF